VLGSPLERVCTLELGEELNTRIPWVLTPLLEELAMIRQVPSLGVPPPWPQGVGFPHDFKTMHKNVFLCVSCFYS